MPDFTALQAVAVRPLCITQSSTAGFSFGVLSQKLFSMEMLYNTIAAP